MIFGKFCKICLFIEKRPKKGKKKGLGPAHNDVSPIARIQLSRKRSPPGKTHSDVDILHQEL